MILYDDDFQSYAVGANPPYGNLFNNNVIPSVVRNTVPPGGQWGVAKWLQVASLAETMIWPTAAPSNVLPNYSEFSIFQNIQILVGQGSDEEGAIIDFTSNLNVNTRIQLAAVRILPDGTLAFTCPFSSAFSPNQAVSDFSLLVGSYYTIQTNVRFSTVGGFVAVDLQIGVNGKAVISASFISVQPAAALPVLYVNAISFGGAGGGCAYGRLIISDTILPIGADPHAGAPDVRVTQGAIELILAASAGVPVPLCPLGGGVATVGVLYNKTLTVSGGIAPYAWVISGLPPGIAYNTVTGQLLGTPTTAGTFTYHAIVSDLATATASVDCTIVVSERLTVDIQFWGVLRFLVPEGDDAGAEASTFSAIAPTWRRRLAAIALRAAARLLEHFARKLVPASSGNALELAAAPASAALETAADRCRMQYNRSTRKFEPFAQPVAQTLRQIKELAFSVTIRSPRFRFAGGFRYSRGEFAQPVAQTLRQTNELPFLFASDSPKGIRGEKTPAFLRGGV